MYFEQFYLTCLAHASYLIGSEGEAAVVDPQRDVDIYLKAAAEQGLQIRHIFETHLHADFVSGHKELAERTGAKIYIGAQADAEFPHVAADGRIRSEDRSAARDSGTRDARPYARERLPGCQRREGSGPAEPALVLTG